ncbi:DUF4181 domain-containing protein [Virgibacillus ndiopensis]|uniref:DUF4181 domain-containing protein n=1 Tax=Virgibacillus ndiopensis TaxID=2004408 RepID=UPI000C089DC4|nr:DUF4181 domain-containing protein [Virgibacillus ndiopensis]
MEAAISLLAFFIIFLNVKLSKWLFKEKRNKISETDGEKIYFWGILLLAGFGIFYFIATIDTIDSDAAKWFLLCYIIVVYSFKTFMEWKYLNESKQYVIPLILMTVGVIYIFGIFLINEQIKYTTFQKIVADQLNEDSTVRSITIYINDLSGTFPDREASTTIKDKEIINHILADLSNLELRKEDSFQEYWEYSLRIVTTNQVEEDHYSTESFSVHVDRDYISISEGDADLYKIVTQSDFLKTIESLVESDEVDWDYKK